MSKDQAKLPLRTKKVAFWEGLANASNVGFPQSPEEYADLYKRWRLIGFYEPPRKNEFPRKTSLVKRILDELKRMGYVMVNKDPRYCICGQRIKRRWLIVSHIDKKYAFIGSECKERFFYPAPTNKLSTLVQALMLTRVLLEEVERLNLDKPGKGLEKRIAAIRRFMGTTIHYIEKTTIFKKRLKVSQSYANYLEQYTGLEWKWQKWGSDREGKNAGSKSSR